MKDWNDPKAFGYIGDTPIGSTSLSLVPLLDCIGEVVDMGSKTLYHTGLFGRSMESGSVMLTVQLQRIGNVETTTPVSSPRSQVAAEQRFWQLEVSALYIDAVALGEVIEVKKSGATFNLKRIPPPLKPSAAVNKKADDGQQHQRLTHEFKASKAPIFLCQKPTL